MARIASAPIAERKQATCQPVSDDALMIAPPVEKSAAAARMRRRSLAAGVTGGDSDRQQATAAMRSGPSRACRAGTWLNAGDLLVPLLTVGTPTAAVDSRRPVALGHHIKTGHVGEVAAHHVAVEDRGDVDHQAQ